MVTVTSKRLMRIDCHECGRSSKEREGDHDECEDFSHVSTSFENDPTVPLE